MGILASAITTMDYRSVRRQFWEYSKICTREILRGTSSRRLGMMPSAAWRYCLKPARRASEVQASASGLGRTTVYCLAMGGNTAAQNLKATAIGRNVAVIQERIAKAARRVGRSSSEVTLVAVTKTVDASAIQGAFAAGLRHFGESRIQEAKEKLPQLSALQPPPTWHMVGHLQTNKAKTATELFDVIHSIDSLKVAEAVSQHAKCDISVLVQVNVAAEASKHGFALEDTVPALEHIARLPHLRTKGLMTIAPYADDPDKVRSVFRRLRLMRDSLGLEHLSMGMSDDFEVAIEEGATMVRIGRAIFGGREE